MRFDSIRRRLAGVPGLALAGVLCAVLAMAPPAQGKEAAPATADPALEAHVMRLSAELRCLVCQNETIAASHADLAVDLRNQVREMLRNGQTDRQVFDYMTARYGDFVLYRPPLKSTTALLWFGPFVFLAGGLAGLWWMLRRRNRLPADQFEPDENDENDAGPANRPRS
jgi:cytochrome c-type biogenesis protein CcmH